MTSRFRRFASSRLGPRGLQVPINKQWLPEVAPGLFASTGGPQVSSVEHHPWLTEDVGHPKLREHLASVISLMKISQSRTQFMGFLNRAHPKWNETLPLPFPGSR